MYEIDKGVLICP